MEGDWDTLHSEYENKLTGRSPAKSSRGNNRGTSSPAGSAKGTPPRTTYSDRFIPSRGGRNLQEAFSLIKDGPTEGNQNSQNASNEDEAVDGEEEPMSTYALLLKSELLGDAVGNSPTSPSRGSGGRSSTGGASSGSGTGVSGHGSPSRTGRHARSGSHGSPSNLFRFSVDRHARTDAATAESITSSPVGPETERLLASPRRSVRKISKVPFKVLDAPNLQDDFYLNLVDWSAQNTLAVGLDSSVYLWSACTSKVTKLCSFGSEDCVTSVSWTRKGSHLAIGTNTGDVQLWDAATCQCIRTMDGHVARVGTLAWNSTILSSGSRDRHILHRDMRSPDPYISTLVGHKQEVCGLKWSHDDQQLASGGNDNRLFVWNMGSKSPLLRFNQHTAAVKAIAWSPHQHGLLASGGGTADRCIRTWNTTAATQSNPGQCMLNCVDTGSQVCNLAWSKSLNELVSTHGYSQNQIVVWRYPSMTPVASLTGHTLRVLYLAMSPDGQTIVTGAGDETLRFYSIWPQAKGTRRTMSLLDDSNLSNIR